MKTKFRNKKELILAFILLYFFGNFISFFGFYFKYKKFIQMDNLIGGNFITGIISLPIAFGNFFFTDMYDFGSVVLVSIFFWSLMMFLLMKLFKNKSVFVFLVFATIFLVASWKWLIVTEALMGI